MFWSRRFEELIELPDARKLKTLADAMAWLAKEIPMGSRRYGVNYLPRAPGKRMTEEDNRRLLEMRAAGKILDFDCREMKRTARAIDGRMSVLRRQIAEGQNPAWAAGPTVNKRK